MTGCRDVNGLFGRCELGKGCGVLALALYIAGCRFNNAVNGVYGFGFSVARIAFAGMLCGRFAVIAVPSVLGFAPVVTENRIFNYGSLSGKAVLVLAKLCGVGYFALFFAGRVLGYGGGVHLFGVNMVAVVLADYLSGEGAVVCAPLVGGLAPLMTGCRDVNGLFGRCELGKGCNELALALYVAGCCFDNAVNGVYGFLLNLVGVIESCMNRSNGAVILAPCIGGFAPILPCKDGVAAVDICAVRMEACTKECDHFGSFHFGFGLFSAKAAVFGTYKAGIKIIRIFAGSLCCIACGHNACNSLCAGNSTNVIAVSYGCAGGSRSIYACNAARSSCAVCSNSNVTSVVAIGNNNSIACRISNNSCYVCRTSNIYCREAAQNTCASLCRRNNAAYHHSAYNYAFYAKVFNNRAVFSCREKCCIYTGRFNIKVVYNVTVTVKFAAKSLCSGSDRSPVVTAERNVVHQLYFADCGAFVYLRSNPCKLCAGSYFVNAVSIGGYFGSGLAVPSGFICFAQIYGDSFAGCYIGRSSFEASVLTNIAFCGYIVSIIVKRKHISSVCFRSHLCAAAVKQFNGGIRSIDNKFCCNIAHFTYFYGDVGQYTSGMEGFRCTEVCTNAVIGQGSVLANAVRMCIHIEVDVASGEYFVSCRSCFYNILVITAERILTAFCEIFVIFHSVRNVIVSYLVTKAKSGVINAGEFRHRQVKTDKMNF